MFAGWARALSRICAVLAWLPQRACCRGGSLRSLRCSMFALARMRCSAIVDCPWKAAAQRAVPPCFVFAFGFDLCCRRSRSAASCPSHAAYQRAVAFVRASTWTRLSRSRAMACTSFRLAAAWSMVAAATVDGSEGLSIFAFASSRRHVILQLPVELAVKRAVLDWESFELWFAFLARRSFTVLVCPFSAAIMSGVVPVWSVAFRLAL